MPDFTLLFPDATVELAWAIDIKRWIVVYYTSDHAYCACVDQTAGVLSIVWSQQVRPSPAVIDD